MSVCLSVCLSFCLSLHLSLCVCLFFYLSLYNRLSTIVHDFGPATAGAWSHVISGSRASGWLAVFLETRSEDFLAICTKAEHDKGKKCTGRFSEKIRIFQNWQKCTKNQGFFGVSSEPKFTNSHLFLAQVFGSVFLRIFPSVLV